MAARPLKVDSTLDTGYWILVSG